MAKIPIFTPKVTKLARNSPKSESLKTTIPQEIVRILKLKTGGEVVWRLYMDPNGNAAAYFSTPENFDKLFLTNLNTGENLLKEAQGHIDRLGKSVDKAIKNKEKNESK